MSTGRELKESSEKLKHVLYLDLGGGYMCKNKWSNTFICTPSYDQLLKENKKETEQKKQSKKK